MHRSLFLLVLLLIFSTINSHAAANHDLIWAAVVTPNREARTSLVNAGIAIDSVVDDTSYVTISSAELEKIKRLGFTVKTTLPAEIFRNKDFPSQDSPYHNYNELQQELQKLAQDHPDLITLFSAGKSAENREVSGLRFNSDIHNSRDVSSRPGIVFMGGHHAREHLSVEIPLLLAKYLADNNGRDPIVTNLLKTRDIFILPMVNPDGAEFDIATSNYRMWRKNRVTHTGAQCAGVDLNRNYGYFWGSGGSSRDSCSDVFMGPAAFSEPETKAIKNFVESHPNLKVLLSFHSYSELILYPWGHSYDPIPNEHDLRTYQTMAQTMARWNGYAPQQASELYIASGDTTDWSYGTLGIFSFTFELSPTQWGGGGFYPGAGAINPTFQANIRPALYLIDIADDPHRAVRAPQTTLFYGGMHAM